VGRRRRAGERRTRRQTPMDLHVRGRRYLVLGGRRGLGRAVAQALQEEGATVVVTSRQPHPDPSFRVLDTGQYDSIAQFVQSWRDPLAGIFVNTGGPAPGTLTTLTDREWQSVFQTLLHGPLMLVRELLPYLERPSAILFNTSTSIKVPIANLLLSNVFRAAVYALAKSLASELASSDIRVNVIAPGRIQTDRVDAIDHHLAEAHGLSWEDVRQRQQRQIPLGRYGTPSEFGRAAAWLLSPAASYITGAAMFVDGGLVQAL
jgi:3-oxoacyl-[acyl-carrier protein] reductase